jgi:N-acylglucosamine-6-phosphate 2-epimerase
VIGSARPPGRRNGRVHTTEQAAEALPRLGAHTVVVGTAVTHPAGIARWFAAALEDALPPD